MKIKVSIPDPNYYVWFGGWNKRKPWVLQNKTKGFQGNFKTKKEANRAIPMIEEK